jgi:hypothetical protein
MKGCRAVDLPETESQKTESQKTESEEERIGDDLLKGAKRIADEIKCKPHQVNYIYKTKKLPIGKMGKQYIASRRGLRRAFQKYTKSEA